MHDLAVPSSRRPVFVLMTSDEVTGAAKRVGFWLRMARERANLSQPAAAKMLGLSNKSASTLSAWEAGTREPSPSKLRAMSELYQTPISLFYDPPLTAYEQIEALAVGQRITSAAGSDADAVVEMRRRVDELRPSQQPHDAERQTGDGHPPGTRAGTEQ